MSINLKTLSLSILWTRSLPIRLILTRLIMLKKNTSERRTLARHEESFNLQVLVDQSQKYLKSKGKLYFIYRAERIAEVISVLQASHFGITKIRFVYGKKKS